MSTPSYLALSIQQFLTKNGMTLVPHPPYLLNLSPSNYFLFPLMKKVLKGKRFANVQEVKEKMAEALKGIKIDELKNRFEQWKKVSIGASNREYFEVTKV